MRYTAIDFESTGCVPGFRNTPWQIGVVALEDGVVRMEGAFASVLKIPADQPFNPYTPGRWAVLRAELESAPAFLELWPQLQPYLTGGPLVAHNVPTERTFLRHFFPLHQFGPWIDTLPLAQAAFPGLPNYRLEELTSRLGLLPEVQRLCPDLAPHDALYDAVACSLLLRLILSAPPWNRLSPQRLARVRP